jgi:DNA-binding HxlR family transcriptional regulator
MSIVNQQLVSRKNVHQSECAEYIVPVRDALDVLYGRWKLPIIISLTFGSRRFKQIIEEIPGLTDKSLSKELKELESNQLITRKVYESFPPRVEYSITEHGRSLEKVINELRDWGKEHRKKIMVD